MALLSRPPRARRACPIEPTAGPALGVYESELAPSISTAPLVVSRNHCALGVPTNSPVACSASPSVADPATPEHTARNTRVTTAALALAHLGTVD
eukprot:2342379-Pleurochrysis_carterae.AAC.1